MPAPTTPSAPEIYYEQDASLEPVQARRVAPAEPRPKLPGCGC